jgi:hypothetical protein
MYQIRCLFIHVNIIPDPTRTFKNGKGPHLPKIGDGPGPTFQKPARTFHKSTTIVFFEGPGPLSIFGRSGSVVFLGSPGALSIFRARCVFGRSEPVVFLEGPGPLSIFGRFGPVVNIWTVQARCRYLEGQGSLSIFGKSGLVVFWKVRARCLFGKSRPVVDFWKVRARCFFGKSGPVVFLVDSGWAPGGFRLGSGSGRFRVGSMSGPVGLWVDSERIPGRFRVVSGSILGGFRVGPRWTLRGSGSIPLGSGSDQAGSGWFSGWLRVVSG